MFDQILNLVKEHLSGDRQLSSAIPADQADAVHTEIAQHVTNGLTTQAAQGGVEGLLNKLRNGITSGSPVASAVEGGLVSSLASKFGLPPMATGAIAAMMPGLLQKFLNKADDPNDHSITPDTINKSLNNTGGNGLSGLFNL